MIWFIFIAPVHVKTKRDRFSDLTILPSSIRDRFINIPGFAVLILEFKVAGMIVIFYLIFVTLIIIVILSFQSPL